MPDAPLSTAIYRLARAHKTFAAALLRELGLYPNQELLLLELEGRERTSQGELVRALMLDHSTVAKSLRRLEHAGLVARAPSAADRRAVDVWLTEKGTQLVERIHAVWRELETTATDGLAVADVDELVRRMAAVQHRVEQELADRGEPAVMPE